VGTLEDEDHETKLVNEFLHKNYSVSRTRDTLSDLFDNYDYTKTRNSLGTHSNKSENCKLKNFSEFEKNVSGGDDRDTIG
jgi:hypothetical protein